MTMGNNMNHFYEEFEDFLNIYYAKSASIDLDSFLSILLFRILNNNLLEAKNDPKLYALLTAFEDNCYNKYKVFHNVPTEYFLVVIRDWLKSLDLSVKKTYIYTLGIFDGVNEDGSLVYSIKNDEMDDDYEGENIQSEFSGNHIYDGSEVESVDNLGQNEGLYYTIGLQTNRKDEDSERYEPQEDICYSVSEQIILMYQKRIIERYRDKTSTLLNVALDELIECLGELLLSYDECYKEDIENDILFSNYLDMFGDILHQEDWTLKMSERCAEQANKGKISSLLKAIGIRCEYIKFVPNKDDSFLIVTEINLDELYASISEIESRKEKNSGITEEQQIEYTEDNIIEQHEDDGDIYEDKKEDNLNKEIEIQIIEDFQCRIIESLKGDREKHFKYVDIVLLLAEALRPFVKDFKVHNFDELSAFFIPFKDALEADDWRNQIGICVEGMSQRKRLDSLPHERHLSYFSDFINNGLTVYIKLKDKVVLDKTETNIISDDIDKQTNMASELAEIQDSVSDIKHYSISEQILLKFQKIIIDRYVKESVSSVELDKLMVCLGEVLISYEYCEIRNEYPIARFLELFGDLCCKEDWRQQISSRCLDLIKTKKASSLLEAVQAINARCQYVKIIPCGDDVVEISVGDNLDDLYASVSGFVSNLEQQEIVYGEEELECEEETNKDNQDNIYKENDLNDVGGEEEEKEEGFVEELFVEVVNENEIVAEGMYTDSCHINRCNFTANDENLNKFWKQVFPEGEPNPPFWKHCMNQSDYEKLKNELKICIEDNKFCTIKNHSLKLAFFISEWYKREYDGNNSNVFEELGIRSTDTKHIWETLKFKAPLYKTNDTIRWLDSIYVLGGLPLKYCQTVYADIVSRLHELKSEGITDWSSDDLTINNAIVEKSLSNPTGSLYLYVNQILNGNYPFAEADKTLPLFSNFMGMFENEENRLEASFDVVREYYKNEEHGIYREFRIRLKNLLKNRYISYEQITPYSIRTDIPSFEIKFKFEKNKDNGNYSEKYKLHFTNDYCGHFVGYGIGSEIVLDDIPLHNIEKLTIEIKGGDSSLWQNSISFDSYVQLYSDGSGVWTNKQTSASNQTAVLYDGDIFERLEGCVMLPLSDGYNRSKEFCWKDIDDKVELKYKQGNENLKLLNNCADYRLKMECLYDTISYINVNEIKVCIRGEEKTMPLLLGIQSLKVYSIDEEGNLSEPDGNVLKYRLPDEKRYHEWNNDKSIKQGVLFLKCGNVIQEVYYLPKYDNDIVSRDCDSHIITWAEHIEVLGGEHVYKDEDIPSCLDIIKEFQLGNSECYAKVPVYRPYSGMYLYKNNGICQKTNKIEIPFILQNRYHVMLFGDKPSIKWLGENSNAYYLLDDNNEMKLEYDEFASIILYKWKEVDSISFIEKNINASKDKEEYKFFYWSKRMNDSPELISTLDEKGVFRINKNLKGSDGGIVFQSLKGCTPSCYYKLDSKNVDQTGKEINFDFMLKCFNMACEHDIYFAVFDELNELLLDPQSLPTFVFRQYNENSRIDYKNLIRFSAEYVFIWSLLKRYTWIDAENRVIRMNRDYEKNVIELLRYEGKCYHEIDEYIDKYFSENYFKTEYIVGRNNDNWLSIDDDGDGDSVYKTAVRYIRCIKKGRTGSVKSSVDYNGNTSPKKEDKSVISRDGTKLDFFQKFIETDCFYRELYYYMERKGIKNKIR